MRVDWIECKLGEILFLTSEKYKGSSGGDDVFYIGLEHIEKNLGILTNSVGVEKIFTDKNKFYPNQILYGKLRPYLNKCYLSKETGVCSTDILVFDISKAVNSKLVHLYMLSRDFVNEMSNNTSGVNLPRVSTKVVQNYIFSLPPLPEQRAIVKKLESLFSSLDAGVADLKKAQQQLKIYRQAVLKKAFEGDLTKNEIEYKTIGEIGKVKGGKRLPKGHIYVENSLYPYLRVTDFDNLSIDTSKLKYISKETHKLISRYTISKDDVFISIAGTIGQVGIIPDHLENANLTENAAKITELKDVNNKYLAHYLSSSLAKSQITEKTMATTQPKLALFRIEKIVFPYYSIIKQAQIVKQIESRLSVCDSIEQNIKESLEKAEALRQSILKKAFEGNLLTAQELAECKQAEDYEPASALLERIKAEQKEIKAKPSKKK